MIKPSQIREREFSKSTMGGYKTAEVDNFLDDVAVSYEQLYKENSELLKKLRLLVENIEDYRKKEQEGKFTPDAALTAAKEEADKIIADARLQAQRIVADAESQAKEIESDSSSLDELRQLCEKEEKKLNKFVCSICNYEHLTEDEELPEDFTCPKCTVPASLFTKK
jgi:cell division initiation protein